MGNVLCQIFDLCFQSKLDLREFAEAECLLVELLRLLLHGVVALWLVVLTTKWHNSMQQKSKPLNEMFSNDK